jgi:hypothetical protein
MKKLKPEVEFMIHPTRSEVLQFSLPSAVIAYCSLRQVDSFDRGIHRNHFYETLHEREVATEKTLTHLHRVHVQGRLNHGLSTPICLR